ncbi:MAG: diphosphokinase / guanosine-3,5-bis(diphosphate) 3-diphosphatase, partial [Actinomycetota bacterium]|nr:diphosphokinase / guanosine-3,5-bis(diphosphate) 3-diphosphatase [Actinomycetota bacterium]
MTSAPPRPGRHPNVDGALRPLLESVRSGDDQRETDLIEDAYEVARDAHRDQVRRSGDPYIAHPLGVAMILSDLGLDDITLAGALLHDAVEDTSVTLADRLHNMRTIASLPEVKQKRIAQETLDIYAPLAHRLGVQDVKWQLEDLAFAVLHPKRYAEIEAMVLQHAGERERYLEEVVGAVRARLEQLHINAEVTGRPKHYWSIYEKMVVRGKEFAEINDLVGVRVIVESVKDCYGALGSIHALWRPVQGRFKDFIAMPKFNLYQSLHTTVVGPQGRAVEFQIRTSEMHRRSE